MTTAMKPLILAIALIIGLAACKKIHRSEMRIEPNPNFIVEGLEDMSEKESDQISEQLLEQIFEYLLNNRTLENIDPRIRFLNPTDTDYKISFIPTPPEDMNTDIKGIEEKLRILIAKRSIRRSNEVE